MMSSVSDEWAQLVGAPSCDALSEVFHENSKIRRVDPALNLSVDAMQVLTEGYKTYPRAEVISLPEPAAELTTPISAALRARRSIRRYGDTVLRASVLSDLLFYAVGQTSEVKQVRTYPSAGALYPLEIYPLVLRSEELPVGVFHYNVRSHGLEVVPGAGRCRDLGAAIFDGTVAETANLVLAITGVFGRSRLKYGERGYRFTLLEAGHAAQNLCLTGAAMELGVCPLGGFVDDVVNDILDVDGLDEAAIYLLAFGSVVESSHESAQSERLPVRSG